MISGDELKLVHPHTNGIHKCNDYTQSTVGKGIPAEDFDASAADEEEDDGDFFGMFD